MYCKLAFSLIRKQASTSASGLPALNYRYIFLFCTITQRADTLFIRYYKNSHSNCYKDFSVVSISYTGSAIRSKIKTSNKEYNTPQKLGA